MTMTEVKGHVQHVLYIAMFAEESRCNDVKVCDLLCGLVA